jgi:nucleotide sugar dehydrogenase
MKISIVGLGYVGLCTATTFASRGFPTIGIDVDARIVQQVAKGKATVHEPRLDPMVRSVNRRNLLRPTTDISMAVDSSITFLTVGTPSQPDGSIDLSYVESAAKELGTALKEKDNYHLVVVKSTVVPGTTRSVVKPILEGSSGKITGSDLGLCANPEFLSEGTAIRDAFHPDKIIIGSNDKKSSNYLTRLYRLFYRNRIPPFLS